MNSQKKIRLRADLVHKACDIARQCGFEFVNSSLSGESFYYRWSDCPLQLRISSHAREKDVNHPGRDMVIASVGFGHFGNCGIEYCSITDSAYLDMVAKAIGRYMIKRGEWLSGEEPK